MFNKEKLRFCSDDLLLPYDVFSDSRGSLSVTDGGKLPFNIERVFWLHDIPEGSERGGHAHQTCRELLIALQGSMCVDLTYGHETLTFQLVSGGSGLLIPEMVWCRLYNFSSDFLGLCLASEVYRPEGYFHDFEAYLEAINCRESPNGLCLR